LIWLVHLLGVLLFAQLFLLTPDVATAGGIQLAVAGVLAGWAASAVLARRKSSPGSRSPLLRLMKTPRIAETLLIAAYISGTVSWLSAFASHRHNRFCVAVSLLAVFLCTPLFFSLARYQDSTARVLKNAEGRKRIKATVAWVLITVTYTLPFVGGFAVGAIRRAAAGRFVSTQLSPPGLALLWLCFCAIFLAAVLFRPCVMKLSSVALPALVALAVVLGGSAAMEQIWRSNWYLYTLISIAFLGTALGVWRVVDSLFQANLALTPLVTTKNGTTGPSEYRMK
jgi:hypothetical protein